MTLQEFKQAYTEVLTEMQQEKGIAEDYPWLPNATQEAIVVCVEKMCAAIVEKADMRWDWLKNNPAIKRVAKRFGITSPPQFREIAKTWVIEDAVS